MHKYLKISYKPAPDKETVVLPTLYCDSDNYDEELRKIENSLANIHAVDIVYVYGDD